MRAMVKFAYQPAEATYPAPSSLEQLIEAAVERAVLRSIGPLLRRPNAPMPAVYTVSQAADLLQVSQDTVSRMVRRGVLPRVPHVGGKVLIPRAALDRLASEPQALRVVDDTAVSSGEPTRSRSISSAAPRSEPGTKCR
jgi:excisionase family DNA binding protein